MTVLGKELSDLPEAKSIQTMALGDEHVLILVSKKEVLGFGNNTFGQISIPSLPHPVYAIDCGCEHSGILTEHKDLYLFGLALHGQLGPQLLPGVDHFALGGFFTVIVQKNQVRSFGALEKAFTVSEPVLAVHAQLKHFLVKCEGVVYYASLMREGLVEVVKL